MGLKEFFKRGDKAAGDQVKIVNGVIIDPNAPNVPEQPQTPVAVVSQPVTPAPASVSVPPESAKPSGSTKAAKPEKPKSQPKPVKSEPVKAVKRPDPERCEQEQEEIEKETTRGRLPDIQRFWDYLQVLNRSERTIKEYQLEHKWWTKQAESMGKTVYTLNSHDLEQLLKKLHPATVRRKSAMLRKLAKWYLREGKPRLHSEISKLDSPKMPKRLPGDLGPEEFNHLRLLAREWCTYGRREGIWLGFMLMCGLRISEIQTVEHKNKNLVRVIGKGNKERVLPVPDWLLMAIKIAHRDGRGGWAQKRQLIWKCLAQENIRHPHNLRHTFASECLRRGKTIVEIKVLLGHESIATTDIYARLQVPEDVADLLDSKGGKRK